MHDFLNPSFIQEAQGNILLSHGQFLIVEFLVIQQSMLGLTVEVSQGFGVLNPTLFHINSLSFSRQAEIFNFYQEKLVKEVKMAEIGGKRDHF